MNVPVKLFTSNPQNFMIKTKGKTKMILTIENKNKKKRVFTWQSKGNQ